MEMKMVNVQTRRLELTLIRDEWRYNIFPNYALDTHLLRIRILRQGSLWLFGEACSCPLLSYNCVSIYNLLYDNRCVQNLKVESVDLALELVPLASSVFTETVRNIYPIPEAPVKVRQIQTIVELSLTILMCMWRRPPIPAAQESPQLSQQDILGTGINHAPFP